MTRFWVKVPLLACVLCVSQAALALDHCYFKENGVADPTIRVYIGASSSPRGKYGGLQSNDFDGADEMLADLKMWDGNACTVDWTKAEAEFRYLTKNCGTFGANLIAGTKTACEAYLTEIEERANKKTASSGLSCEERLQQAERRIEDLDPSISNSPEMKPILNFMKSGEAQGDSKSGVPNR